MGHMWLDDTALVQVFFDYCTAVKGILNDDQGGQLHPQGIRMVEPLQSVRESVERCLATKKQCPASLMG